MIEKSSKIPFNKPSFTGAELDYISKAVLSGKISGDGTFAKMCHELLEKKFNAKKILLTTSCTHALELASLLLDLKEGDEVIVPSYTFVSTVNAFILRGAKPIFVDIRLDTKNIDENLIEEKITKNTKAIFPVHYAGVACDMDRIKEIAKRYNLFIVEDAAQGVNAKYKNQYLGTMGTFGCYSFHETKNFMCGEGGAIVINDERFIERAEIIREKGTNRSKFFRGEIDKYTWVDIGSSFLPSDVLAAFLYAQLENMDSINSVRKRIYDKYLHGFADLETKGSIALPFIPKDCISNYHMFYILLNSELERNALIQHLKGNGIDGVFHYVPLHSSPMGLKFGYKNGDLPITEDVSKRLLRLPFYNGISEEEQIYIINQVKSYLLGKKVLAV
ncbi:MAG: dTDP-4-amino-4,6-dideoxygalactose transaminase [Candidatus Melainabacteria bacterium]|nr:dTDP-4-amino-4,6-dideoxygalactose transaminase [Candidatus Melainabacteria bacterium]